MMMQRNRSRSDIPDVHYGQYAAFQQDQQNSRPGPAGSGPGAGPGNANANANGNGAGRGIDPSSLSNTAGGFHLIGNQGHSQQHSHQHHHPGNGNGNGNGNHYDPPSSSTPSTRYTSLPQLKSNTHSNSGNDRFSGSEAFGWGENGPGNGNISSRRKRKWVDQPEEDDEGEDDMGEEDDDNEEDWNRDERSGEKDNNPSSSTTTTMSNTKPKLLSNSSFKKSPQSQSNPPTRSKGPRRGARACTNCRRGKNRCEGEGEGDRPCRRCEAAGMECVFVKPIPKGGNGQGQQGQQGQGQAGMGQGWEEGRYNAIEGEVHMLRASQQSMQTTLSQILAALSSSQLAQQQQPIPNQIAMNIPNGINYIPSPTHSNGSMHPNSISLGASRSNTSPHLYVSGNTGLLPPNHQGPRLDPFSPGTVAALTEVATGGAFGSNEGNVNVNVHSNGMEHSNYSPVTGTSSLLMAKEGEAKLGSTSTESNGIRRDEDGFAWPDPPRPKSPSLTALKIDRDDQVETRKEFPKLPGFKPPPHRYANYALVVSSTAASSDDESEDTLPRSSLNAPIEALHQLANAADQAAKENAQLQAENIRQGGFLSPPRVLQNQLKFKKMKKPDPAPRNAFPDVVTKELVTEKEARELWDIFFSGCHYFIPLFDPNYDIYETFVQRTPFSFDGMLSVAAKIRAGTGPLGRTHTRCLEEAQGIARSTLFGPVVRKEAVMAVLILASWSQDPWLPSGHALRMGLDMNLHKALEKLADKGTGKGRSEAEERDLVVGSRIWLNCYLNDHTVSLGTGRPLMLRDDDSVRNARELLSHPMSSETDLRLIACVELMSHKVRVWDHLHPLHGRVDSATIEFVRRISNDLITWHSEWRTMHLQRCDENSVLVKLLDAELYYAQLWTTCVALRGCNWERLTLDQRELAFQAKDAALKCLSTYKATSLRYHLKYSVHETMVQASFSAVFLLKIAILFPTELTARSISEEVADLANVLSECAAERYALTLRLMLRSFRRKMGETTMAPGTPRTMANGQVAGSGNNGMIPGHRGLESLLSMDGDPTTDFSFLDDLGPFNWPEDGFSPSNLPQWITEGNVMDLGLPWDGTDSIFLPPELANMFLPAPTTWQLSDSGDAGAEAW